MITRNENQNYVQKLQMFLYIQKNFEGVSEILRKIRIRKYVQKQNPSVVRGSNVIMSDFY